jgi:hypothetical protein
LLAHGRWFSPGTPASSTTKSGRHDIVEILLSGVKTPKINQSINLTNWSSIPEETTAVTWNSSILNYMYFLIMGSTDTL